MFVVHLYFRRVESLRINKAKITARKCLLEILILRQRLLFVNNIPNKQENFAVRKVCTQLPKYSNTFFALIVLKKL